MKLLHRDDLYAWSVFDERRDIDFSSVAWVRADGNVLVDPLPMTAHDLDHLQRLGGAAWLVVTNSDHLRGVADLAPRLGARVAGPAAERADFPWACDRWLGDGDELVPGLRTLALEGSKTPGELALVLEGTTLVTGDLVRSHRAGSLTLLPPDKLRDPNLAARSVERLAADARIEAVLVGDGFSVYRDGHRRLAELADAIQTSRAVPSAGR